MMYHPPNHRTSTPGPLDGRALFSKWWAYEPGQTGEEAGHLGECIPQKAGHFDCLRLTAVAPEKIMSHFAH